MAKQRQNLWSLIPDIDDGELSLFDLIFIAGSP
jgi:hypothetical protein